MRRKIHLVTTIYSSKGHGKEYVKNFCSRLKSSFDINLFASIIGDESYENSNFSVTQIAVDYNKTNAEYFKKYYFLAPYLRAIVKQKNSYQYYQRIIKSKKINSGDIVFIMDYDVFPLYFFIKRLKKCNSINYLWVHSARFKSKDLLYRGYKAIFKYLFRNHISPNVRKVIVNGEYIGEQILNNLNLSRESISIIQYPSEISYAKIEKSLARKKLGFKEGEKIILFFGLLRKDKNIELLIKSVANSETNIKLIIAGSEASVSKSNLMKWISTHELNNYFLDIDYISEEKMAFYYSCSDLLVLTYDIESGSQSGPLSLAREFGLPALVTEVGEIGHYVKSNNVGLTAQANSQDAFSSKMDHFFGLSEHDRTIIGKSINLTKDKYSWDSAAKKYRRIFNQDHESV